MSPCPACQRAPLSARINDRIRALMQRTRGRRLTDRERAEYRQLLAVWIRAEQHEQRDQWVTIA